MRHDWRRSLDASPAKFSVGDRVIVDWEDGDGELVQISSGYDLYVVPCENDGTEERFGYQIRRLRGTLEYFVAPHQLIDADCRVRHLRLVARGQA